MLWYWHIVKTPEISIRFVHNNGLHMSVSIASLQNFGKKISWQMRSQKPAILTQMRQV